MKLYEFAKNELELAGLLNEREDFHSGIIGKSVLDLIQLLESQQHNAETKRLTVDFFWKLCNNKNLNHLTNNDEDWIEENGKLVHKRCEKLHKEQDGSVYYTEAIAFYDEFNTWIGSAWLSKEDALSGDKSKMVSSRQRVQSFPFEPKAIWVEVTTQEIGEEVQPIIKGSMEAVWQKYGSVSENI